MREAFSYEDRRRLAIVGAVIGVNAVLLPFARFDFQWTSVLPVLVASFTLTVLGVFYRLYRPAERIAAMAMGTAVLLLFTMALSICNYLAVAFDRPLIDPVLAMWDRALGFDWPAMIQTVQTMPGVLLALRFAYDTTLPQIALMVVALALTGRLERLDITLLALFIAALATVMFWAAFPSFGAFTHYYGLGVPLADAGLVVNGRYAEHLWALRAGQLNSIGADQMLGLIAFPSFHSSLAVLAAYALYPIRFVGPLALALNVLVILSVPVQGGHHLVDIPAGVAVAVAAIAVSSAAVRRRRGRSIDQQAAEEPAWSGAKGQSASV